MQDAVTVITGGGSGIGAALARRIASQDGRVLIADIDRASGEATCREIGPRAEFVELDVADAAAWEGLRDDVVSRYGGIGSLVLNAGVLSGPRGAAVDDRSLTWFTRTCCERVLSVNVNGTVNGLLAFVPILCDQGTGQIVVVSSVDALIPYPQDPFYAMTKASQISLVRSLAPVLSASGVRINAICPYAVATELTPANFRDLPGRGMSADDFVEAVGMVMASDNTGQVWLKHAAGRAATQHVFAPVEGVDSFY